MIDFTLNGVKITLVRKVKQNNSDEQPIYWRITYRRKQVYYFTGFRFSESEWDDFNNRSLRKHKQIKDLLNTYFDKTIKPIAEELAIANSFSFEIFERRLSDGGTQDLSINEAFENKIKTLENEFKVGNASIYRTTLKALMRFKHYTFKRTKKEKKNFIDHCIEKKHITLGKMY